MTAIDRYDPAWVGPALRAGVEGVVHEDAEQIYRFELFTPAACRAILARAEASGAWKTGVDVAPNPYAPDVDDVAEPDTVLPLAKIGLDGLYEEIIRRHLKPLAEHLWPVFEVKRWDPPYLLRYEAGAVASMKAHYDLETCAVVCYLNDGFEGGGTYFPRWRYSTASCAPGTAVMYPGGLSHVHEARPVTAGVRYVLCSCFF